jgi:hypothetical protein
MYDLVDCRSPDIQVQVQPSDHHLQDLLDSWKSVIAKEIVEEWQHTTSELKLGDVLVNSLNLTTQQNEKSFDILQKKLRLNIWQIKESISFADFNLNSNKLLFKSLDDVIEELKATLKISRAKNTEVMQQLISVDWQSSSSHQLATFLNGLLKKLIAQKFDFEHNIKICEEYETSAWEAFLNLNQKLQKVVVDSVQYNNITDSKWRAISVIFQARLKFEYYQDSLYGLQNLIDSSEEYYGLVRRSSQILENLQESLNQRYALEFKITSLPVFMYLNKVNAAEQKKEIENWIGHSINYWGSSSISWQEIERKLLENLEPTILNIYRDFCQYFANN